MQPGQHRQLLLMILSARPTLAEVPLAAPSFRGQGTRDSVRLTIDAGRCEDGAKVRR
jgi:hypothetical protein